MAYLVDSLIKTKALSQKHGWVIAKPLDGTLVDKIKDSFLVLNGKATAITFYSQKDLLETDCQIDLRESC